MSRPNEVLHLKLQSLLRFSVIPFTKFLAQKIQKKTQVDEFPKTLFLFKNSEEFVLK